jgi:hypothetical protein
MGDIFTVVDPRGVIVTCSLAQWENHIIASHPALDGAEKEVESAVASPDIIFQSESHQSRDVYFKSSGSEQMKVIVEVSGNLGEVITAFLREDVKGNINTEVVRYVRPEL